MATTPTGCSTAAIDGGRDFTGNNRYAGSEVDVHVQYSIIPGLTTLFGGGYTFIGDALESNNNKVQDGWFLIARALNVF